MIWSSDKIVIGVGGASCSGKSTLCSYLHCLLPNSCILRQDSFYKSDSLIPVVDGTINWDTPEAIDMPSFAAALSSPTSSAYSCSSSHTQLDPMVNKDQVQKLIDAVKDKNVIIVDGFLIYSDKKIYDHFDVSIFLEATKEELKKRRSERQGYVTIEGYWADPVGYFEDFVWPQYLLYNQNVFQRQIKNLITLSSQQGISKMVNDAVQELIKVL